MTPMLFSPQLWLAISGHVAAAPAEDLWNTMGARPAKSASVPVQEERLEDEMAISAKRKAA